MLFKKYLFSLLLLLQTNLIFSMEEPEHFSEKQAESSDHIFSMPQSLKNLAAGKIILELIEGTEPLKNIHKLPPELQQYLKSVIIAKYYSLFSILFCPQKSFTFEGEGKKITATILSFSDIYNNYALTGSEEGIIKLWDIGTGECLQLFQGHTTAITALAFHCNKPLIASGSLDGMVKVWNMNTGECIQTINAIYNTLDPSPLNAINYLTFIGNHLQLQNYYLFSEWDLNLQTSPLYLEPIILNSRTSNYKISNEQDFVVNGGQNLSINTVNDDRIVAHLRGHQGQVSCCKISNDEQLVATCSNEGKAYLWDLKTGNCLHTFDNEFGIIFVANFSSDNTQLLTVACTPNFLALKIWNIATKTLIRQHIFNHNGKIPIALHEIQVNDTKHKYHIIFSDLTRSIIDSENGTIKYLICPFFDPFLKIYPTGYCAQKYFPWRTSKDGKITSVSQPVLSSKGFIQLLLGCKNGTTELWTLLEEESLEKLIFVLKLACISMDPPSIFLIDSVTLSYVNVLRDESKRLLPTFTPHQQNLIKKKYPFIDMQN